ncbi:hypothetical protein NAK90_000183 [Salmonella enterica]|nr:hypothetical protein [Salmonella enterica]EJG7676806.1 hypothetical protein [Salmonella enterica]
MLVVGLDSVRLAAGAFGCLPGAFANGRQRKAPEDLFINQTEAHLYASQHKDSLLLAKRQGETRLWSH